MSIIFASSQRMDAPYPPKIRILLAPIIFVDTIVMAFFGEYMKICVPG